MNTCLKREIGYYSTVNATVRHIYVFTGANFILNLVYEIESGSVRNPTKPRDQQRIPWFSIHKIISALNSTYEKLWIANSL